AFGDGFEGVQAHEAGDGQGEFGRDGAALRHGEAAAHGDQPVNGESHVRVVGADHGDVVAVMADRGGDGAALQAKTGDEAAADIAVLAVAFDDRELDDVGVAVG